MGSRRRKSPPQKVKKIKPHHPGKTPAIVSLAKAYGIPVFEIIAALRDPALWEIIGGGPHSNYSSTTLAISNSTKKELNRTLSSAISTLSSRLKAGDITAAPYLLQFSMQRAALGATS